MRPGFGPRGLNASHNNEFKLADRGAREDEYRIMILGGSVAAGFGNRGSGGIVEVRRVLKEDPRFTSLFERDMPVLIWTQLATAS